MEDIFKEEVKTAGAKVESALETGVATLKADVSDALLHHKINNRLLALIVFLVVAFGALWVHNIKTQAAHDAVVQQMVHDFRDQVKQDKDDLKASYEKQVDIAKQQKVIEKTIEIRDKKAEDKKGEVTSPDRTVDQTKQDVHDFLNMNVQFLPDQKLFGFTQSDTEKIVTFKIDRDRFEQDALDYKKDLDKEKEKNDLLGKDVARLNGDVAKGQKAIDDLNKEKNPSAFKKTLQGLPWLGAGIALDVILNHKK